MKKRKIVPIKGTVVFASGAQTPSTPVDNPNQAPEILVAPEEIDPVDETEVEDEAVSGDDDQISLTEV